MKTKIYFLSFSFGLGLGITSMHTSNPFGIVMQLAAEGHNLEHVTIKSITTSNETAEAADERQKMEQGWQFMEWS